MSKTKLELLEEYGITLFDGNSINIFLQYKNLKIPYPTNNYLFFSPKYFIKDVLEQFNINVNDVSIVKETAEKRLKSRIEFITDSFKKLGITKCWVGNVFFLQKKDVRIQYSFNDYIEFEQNLLISDIVNKFKKHTNENPKTEISELKSKFEQIVDNSDVISVKKNKIKEYLISKGFYEKK